MKNICKKGHTSGQNTQNRCIQCKKDYYKLYWQKHKEHYNRIYRERYSTIREQKHKKNRKYRTNNPALTLLIGARKRSKVKNIPFTITREDIEKLIPIDGKCPVLDIPLTVAIGKPSPNSMTLDRIDPCLGYVSDNIAVISHLANAIKSNQTDPEVFIKVSNWLRKVRK